MIGDADRTHFHECVRPGCRDKGRLPDGVVYRWVNRTNPALTQDALHASHDPAGWYREWRPYLRLNAAWRPVTPKPAPAVLADQALTDAALTDAVAMAATEVEDHRV